LTTSPPKKKVFIDAASAILLYKANLFALLVDDGRAARFCKAHQIPFINALLVPKIFWYSGFMGQTDCLKKTACLCDLGRYSKKVLKIARQFSRDVHYFIGGGSHGR
jgi:hypothetical protein